MQTPSHSTVEGLSLWQSVLVSFVTGVLGVLGTLVTFRTRLALQDSSIKQVNVDMSREHIAIRQSITALSDSTDARHQENKEAYREALARVDRKMDAILRICVSIARANGTDQRFDDALMKFLSGDES